MIKTKICKGDKVIIIKGEGANAIDPETKKPQLCTVLKVDRIKGRVLILHGAEDEVAPLAEVNKLVGDLRAAKVNWELEVYSGAQHGFTNPTNASEERADREYKVAIQRFFKEIFGT